MAQIVTNRSPTFRGSADDAVRVEVTITEVNSLRIVSSGSGTVTDGRWAYKVNEVLPDGDYRLTLRGYDSVNNVKTSSSLFTIQINPIEEDKDKVMVANYSEAGFVGRGSAGVAGAVTFRHKKIKGIEKVAESIVDDTDIQTLTNKGYNFYVMINNEVRTYGSNKTGSGEWIDGVLGRLWLKIRIREVLYPIIADNDKLSMDTDGAGAIESGVRSVLSEGQNLNVVARDTRPSVRTPNVLELSPEERNTRILANVVFDCRLTGGIEGTVVRGEVYA